MTYEERIILQRLEDIGEELGLQTNETEDRTLEYSLPETGIVAGIVLEEDIIYCLLAGCPGLTIACQEFNDETAASIKALLLAHTRDEEYKRFLVDGNKKLEEQNQELAEQNKNFKVLGRSFILIILVLLGMITWMAW